MANQTYKYLSPSLVATDRLLQGLDRDEGNLTSFLVNGAALSPRCRAPQRALGADRERESGSGGIAAQNRSFNRALTALPGALRQASTTFPNLRPALDDLDLLVNASKTGMSSTFLAEESLMLCMHLFHKLIEASIRLVHPSCRGRCLE